MISIQKNYLWCNQDKLYLEFELDALGYNMLGLKDSKNKNTKEEENALLNDWLSSEGNCLNQVKTSNIHRVPPSHP